MTAPADEAPDQDALATEMQTTLDEESKDSDEGGGDEQDDLAAEWETMVDGDEDGETGEGDEAAAGTTLAIPGMTPCT